MLNKSQGLVRLEGLGKLKKKINSRHGVSNLRSFGLRCLNHYSTALAVYLQEKPRAKQVRVFRPVC
jgi:hypothetical protein